MRSATAAYHHVVPMEDVKTTFGRRLRLIRKSRGLTLEALGQAADIGFKHIGDIEKGQKAPSFDAIDRLAWALKVSPYELFLPYEADDRQLNQAFKKLVRELEGDGSQGLKRFLTVALPLLRQIEAES